MHSKMKDALQLNKMHKDFKTFADDKKKLNISSGDGIDERKSHNSKNNNNNDNEDLEANDVKVEFPSDDNDDDNGRLIGNRVTSIHLVQAVRMILYYSKQ